MYQKEIKLDSQWIKVRYGRYDNISTRITPYGKEVIVCVTQEPGDGDVKILIKVYSPLDEKKVVDLCYRRTQYRVVFSKTLGDVKAFDLPMGKTKPSFFLRIRNYLSGRFAWIAFPIDPYNIPEKTDYLLEEMDKILVRH